MKAVALAALACLLLATGCQSAPETLEPVVIARYPHDASAFTQGLVLEGGRFYESTGLYGQSSLREVIPETGEVLRSVPLEQQYFGEGLAHVDGRLIQLTWRSGVALVYDADTFERIGSYRYDTEGWGLCWDGSDLYMSDGSATLYRRNADTFVITGRVQVTDEGEPVALLNELECVGDSVYANVWQSDDIVRIDKNTGRVIATIDAARLLTDEERAALDPAAVLNGIAWNPTTERFYLTGKLWPTMYEVELRPR